jgi:hypothetical protein
MQDPTGRTGAFPVRVCSLAMMETETKTTNDAIAPNGWDIRDEVMEFREWGTHITYPLPPKHVVSTIGASRDCWMRLWDPNGSVSRTHASLTHGQDGWLLRDLESKNGVFLDGTRVSALPVVPGAEIRIGEVTLIAESPKLIALRSLLERFLGWDDERREVVDQALFSVRVATTHREPLLLCGEGNLVPIARQLHRHAFGDRPFVVARRYAKGMDTLAAAAGGTLCVWRREQPDDFDEVASALQGPQAKALLMVCAHAPPKGNDVASRIVTSVRSIVLPPLCSRAHELRRIIDAYAQDAIAAFGGGWLSPADWEWVERNAAGSLQLIGMVTRRIVALHACDESVTRAAKLLSVTHGSLSDWLARRSLPGKATMPDEEQEEDGG